MPILAALGSGLLAIFLRYREARAEERALLRRALVGFGLFIILIGLLWTGITTLDGWLAGANLGVNFFFSFAPYLLLWLLLPGVTLSIVVKRRRAATVGPVPRLTATESGS